jgi:hypothetical protein
MKIAKHKRRFSIKLGLRPCVISLDYAIFPALMLIVAKQDPPDDNRRVLRLQLCLRWLNIGGIYIMLSVITDRPWHQSAHFKKYPEDLKQAYPALDAAHDRRVRKATNRIMDKIRTKI